MGSLTRGGTAEHVSREIKFSGANRGRGNLHIPCSANYAKDWQPYPVDPYSAVSDVHTYIHIHGQRSQQQSGKITLQSVLINKFKFFKTT